MTVMTGFEVVYGECMGEAVVLQVGAQCCQKYADGIAVEIVKKIPEKTDIEAGVRRKCEHFFQLLFQ